MHCSTGQGKMRSALFSAALQNRLTAGLCHCNYAANLYEEQIFIGVFAVTQACCEPVLKSTTYQWGMQIAQTSAAVHFCWLTAQLHVEQVSTGVIAVTPASCEHVLQSNT